MREHDLSRQETDGEPGAMDALLPTECIARITGVVAMPDPDDDGRRRALAIDL
jgi:hypothetical protein